MMILFSGCASMRTETPVVESSAPETLITQRVDTIQSFYGRWQGIIEPLYSKVTLDIVGESYGVLLSAPAYHVEFLPIDWEVEHSQIILGMNDEEFRITMAMSLSGDGRSLEGTFTQHGVSTDIGFTKISDTPTIGKFNIAWVPVSFEERIRQLRDYPDFADDGRVIRFTYDLKRRDLYADLIEEFNLDAITAGYYDIELMRVLLSWMSDNFRHNGASGMPRNRNAMSIIDYMRLNPSGINCRGLAILLAEVLRLYGIEAKHITVYPPENDHPVHVVTHAWSRELQQWVMLDPSFGMYVTDLDGNLMSLYTLRAAFVNATPIVANTHAMRNGEAVSIEQYKNFMVDYMFRFSTGTRFTLGSEETGMRTTQFMLVPYGFYGHGRGTRTTSAEAFFAPPDSE